jgi:murein DD-endopeptidase MepM/ murein hydrolase activator NlpD
MRRRIFMGALALIAFARAATARASIAYRAMLMPVVKLKQLSRGFGPTPGNGFHTGVDLTAPYGSPVQAAATGTVVFAGTFYGYGNMIDMRHPNGLVTRYAHLSAFAPGLRVGNAVEYGGPIGSIGTSGNAHGPHLHFEVRVDGKAVDPKPYLGLAEPPKDFRAPLVEARLRDPRGEAAFIGALDDHAGAYKP